MEPAYSPGEVELVPRAERAPESDREKPDVITATEIIDEKEEKEGKRRVQWQSGLSRHTSVVMASKPPTLGDEAGRAMLSQALESFQEEERPDSRYFNSSAPSSSAGSTRASSEADPEERMNLIKDEMEIFVDEGETNGLPSASTKTSDQVSKKAAWGLVRSYTSGRTGFMRNRKNATSHDHRPTSGGDEESGSYFDLKGNVAGDPAQAGVSTMNTAGAGGVLSSLMALQRAGQQSAASTPGTSGTPSRSASIDGDSSGSDDEDAREKFTAAQREKRRKNAWPGGSAVAGVGSAVVGVGSAVYGVGAGTVNGVGKVGKAVAGVMTGGANKSTTRPSLANNGRPSSLHAGSGRPTSLNNFITSRSPKMAAGMNGSREELSSNPSSVPSALPSPGLHSPRVPKTAVGESVTRFKRLGEKVGLVSEATRPKMARSGAGVFGGLIASTNNITGAAAPHAATLGPMASRPGYHLSRRSAPIVPTVKSLSGNASRISLDLGASPEQLSPPTTVTSSTNVSALPSPSKLPKPAFSLHLKDLPNLVGITRPLSSAGAKVRPLSMGGTPESEAGDYFMGHRETQLEREDREWEKEKRRRKHKKDKRKQEEVFIVAHVAAILSRQDFLMKLGRSFMMFGAPSHRLEAQMQATARVLDINAQVIYIPGVMLISFGDSATHTSEIKFLKQANGLDLGKLLAAYYVYYNVIHDQVSVDEASTELDGLMIAPARYTLWQNLLIGGFAAALIQPTAFYGSLIDCLVSIPLGALLVLVQVVVSKNDLYSSLFEIVIVCVNSFLAAALASTGQFCFAAVASGSIVLILPGYIVLCGSLELANRSIISGSVRLVFSVLYSLFIGFAFSMGSEVYGRITGLDIVGSTDYTCSALRVDAPWYRATISPWFFFISAPAYLFVLGLRNGQPVFRKETIIMIIIGSAGWVSNFFSSKAFPGRADISSAVGSFVVGLLGNFYGKFTKGSPFVVMVVGVLFQLPSGLSNGGLLQFANSANSENTNSYSAGFQTAQSLVEVAIGLTVGLFVSAAIVNFFGGGRRRGSNLSSF